MKVLHVLHHSFPFVDGYAMRSRYILRSQKRSGIQPFAITSWSQPGIPQDSVEFIDEIPHFRFIVAGLPNKRSGHFSALPITPFFKFVHLVSNLIRKLKPNFIHAHSPATCGYVALLAASGGIPFIYEVRGLWEESSVHRKKFSTHSLSYVLAKRAETILVKTAKHTVTISRGLKEDMLYRGVQAEKVSVIPNGVDTNEFNALPRNKALIERYGLKDKMVIAYIGSLSSYEGLECLLMAAPKIRESYPNVKVLIIGGGPEEDNLRALANRLCITNELVVFAGKVPVETVKDYYSIADILVYPRTQSRLTELVTPLKPLEAMAMQKLVVMSDVGGLKELAGDGNACMFFRSADPNHLAEQCVRLIVDTKLRNAIGIAARSLVQRDRSWDTMGEKYHELYQTLLSHH